MAASGRIGSIVNRIARVVGLPFRERVGHDQFGNVYYVVRKRVDERSSDTPLRAGVISWHDLRKKEERHVEWAVGGSRCGEYSPHLLPPEWSQWLNFRRVEPPQSELAAGAEQPEKHIEAQADEARMLQAERLAAVRAPAAVPAAQAKPAATTALAAPVTTMPPPPSTSAESNSPLPAMNSAVRALREGDYKPSGWSAPSDVAYARNRRRTRGSKAVVPPGEAQATGSDQEKP